MVLSENKSFSVEYNTLLPGFLGKTKQYVASIDGKIKTVQVICPKCKRTDYVDNGYHLVEDDLIQGRGLTIRIAQFLCKKCGTYWSSERELIDNVIQKQKDFVKSLLLGCARAGLSFEKSTILVDDSVGKSYSSQYLHKLYVIALEQVRQEKFTSTSGVYNYDEQFLKVNGEQTCRLVIKDRVTGKVIVDVQTPDAKKETIQKVMQTALEGLPVDVFIVDMNSRYPELIRELFPNAKIQWCIFHLDKLIWKELQDEFGKNPPLCQLYNVYTLFDIFFDHSLELVKLQELLKKFETLKTKDEKSNKQIEKTLRKEFSQFVKGLKKQRRREHKKVPRKTLAESEETFATIIQQSTLYPKKLQKRINYIQENWNKFTLFQRDTRVEPTNNGVEHYFAATLTKTDKKDFRSNAAVTRELTAAQAEWNGAKLFSTTKLIEVIPLIGLLYRAFPS
ncbi:MAG TPA: transposase [Patescibacteria group bacterium]|nr:transposase [Patescibacteria group bacterium]